MTKTKRKAVVKTLREWAAWSEAHLSHKWWHAWGELDRKYMRRETWRAASAWCDASPNNWHAEVHTGPTAATGLLLAAAMVEAGDEA